MRRVDPDQTFLFERAQEKAGREEQKKQVARVRGKIHMAILSFFAVRRPGAEFTGTELYKDIRDKNPDLAPDSPGRIMRLLRSEGLINYKVVSRKDSRYEILATEET